MDLEFKTMSVRCIFFKQSITMEIEACRCSTPFQPLRRQCHLQVKRSFAQVLRSPDRVLWHCPCVLMSFCFTFLTSKALRLKSLVISEIQWFYFLRSSRYGSSLLVNILLKQPEYFIMCNGKSSLRIEVKRPIKAVPVCMRATLAPTFSTILFRSRCRWRVQRTFNHYDFHYGSKAKIWHASCFSSYVSQFRIS